MMDLWSFIPYYMGQLCSSLGEESVEVTLGSARYHLDRDYFRKVGLNADSILFDVGGRIGSPIMRRLVKSVEYLANLVLLSIRFLFSRPNILHVQYLPFLERGLPFELWFVAWAQRRGIPVVYTVHNLTPQNAPGRFKALYARMYRLPDALICHGEQARVQLIQDYGASSDKVKVIPHGPLFAENLQVTQDEARAHLGLSVEDPIILCLGVISEYKGIPFLLDSWKKTVQSGGKGRLVIAGTGDPRLLSSIRDKVSADGLTASVDLRLEFVPVEKLHLFYQAADVLVYPYKAGTTSGALLTGINYRKAIIATKLPFFCEYLRDGESALLVDYGDTNALARALGMMLDEPQERTRLACSSDRRNSGAISWTKIAKATRACYSSLIKENKYTSPT